MSKVRIAISLGDPAGIGPEVTAKALRDPGIRSQADFILAGLKDSHPGLPKSCEWMALPRHRYPKGRPSRVSGKVAAQSVHLAAKLVMQGGADAMVTAPLSKEALHLAGEDWAGHTEMLADLAGLEPEEVGMLLVGGKLRVFLATRHMSLLKAVRSLRRPMLKRAVTLCARGLSHSFGLKRPRLALAALNPHAGEAGAFGHEEERLLRPLVGELASSQDFSLEGPFPADTLFVKAAQGTYDAVVCLYHDQGLIPLKLLAFSSGVNVTLGLPFIRTSPDHGTAYDIAGKNLADPDSMKAALRLAIALARRRRG